ncbi:unnamed protein product [Symbiodinium sp. CCMP2592]|nr:unnamed protein product [Symbiodinium sp. CCMP2592]
MPLQHMEAIRAAPTPAWSDSMPKAEAHEEPQVTLEVEDSARELEIYNHSVQWTWADPGDPGNEWRPKAVLAILDEGKVRGQWGNHSEDDWMQGNQYEAGVVLGVYRLYCLRDL